MSKKNELKVNNLPLVFNGFVQVNETNQEVQLDFKTLQILFDNFNQKILKMYEAGRVVDLVPVNEIKKKAVRGLLKKRAKQYDSDDN